VDVSHRIDLALNFYVKGFIGRNESKYAKFLKFGIAIIQ